MPLLLLGYTIATNKNSEKEFFSRFPKKLKRAAFFASGYDPERRYFYEVQEHYKEFGITEWVHVNFDRDFDASELDEAMRCDLIHLSGGCTPYFLHHMQVHKAHLPLLEYEKRGGLIVGVSAGSILLGPSLEIGFDDPPEKEMSDKYNLLKGLGLYNFEFYPHFANTEAQNQFIKNRLAVNGRDIAVCTDGGGVIVDGANYYTVGTITWLKQPQ